jgi:DNA-binding NtrC family response regulator
VRACILVVEQDLLVRETIIDLMRALGHHAVGAPSPARGLKLFEMIDFDVMFISPRATEIGKPSYALEAKKIQPHLKVIMAAAMQSPEFSQLPIDAFIEKPFSLLTLAETLRKISIPSDLSDDRLR